MYKLWVYPQITHMGKIIKQSGMALGVYKSKNKCAEMAHFFANEHNGGFSIHEPTRRQIERGTMFEYPTPAWVEPRKVGENKIVFSVAYKYSFKKDPLTTHIRYVDNAVIVNYGDNNNTKMVFYFEEV